jgi:hypothetical protein
MRTAAEPLVIPSIKPYASGPCYCGDIERRTAATDSDDVVEADNPKRPAAGILRLA